MGLTAPVKATLCTTSFLPLLPISNKARPPQTSAKCIIRICVELNILYSKLMMNIDDSSENIELPHHQLMPLDPQVQVQINSHGPFGSRLSSVENSQVTASEVGSWRKHHQSHNFKLGELGPSMAKALF